MTRAILCQLVLLVSVCVLSMFFFPAGQGPYPAVHGPITALQSLQNSTRFLVSFLFAACLIFGFFGTPWSRLISRVFVKWNTAVLRSCAEGSTVLRC
jgi:hypothetical protein